MKKLTTLSLSLIVFANFAFAQTVDTYRAYHHTSDGYEHNNKFYEFNTTRIKEGDEFVMKVRVEKLGVLDFKRDDLEHVIAFGFDAEFASASDFDAYISFDDGLTWQEPIYKTHENYKTSMGPAHAIVFKQWALSNGATKAKLKLIAKKDGVGYSISTGAGFRLTRNNQFYLVDYKNHLSGFGLPQFGMPQL